MEEAFKSYFGARARSSTAALNVTTRAESLLPTEDHPIARTNCRVEFTLNEPKRILCKPHLGKHVRHASRRVNDPRNAQWVELHYLDDVMLFIDALQSPEPGK